MGIEKTASYSRESEELKMNYIFIKKQNRIIGVVHQWLSHEDLGVYGSDCSGTHASNVRKRPKELKSETKQITF